MKKTALKSLALKAVSVAIVAVSMANVANAADWTPYLKSIQHNCNYEALAKDLMAKKVPANLKADVVKQTAKHRKIRKEYYADEDIASIQLKNATAFGAPLQKISYKSVVGEGSGEAEYVLHFTNANFMKALPTFTFQIASYPDSGFVQTAGQKRMWLDSYLDNKVVYQEAPYRVVKDKDVGIRYDFPKSLTAPLDGEYDVYVSKLDGWLIESFPYGGAELTFNSKNKTISCVSR